MATTPEEVAQSIALAFMNDPKVAAKIRDEWGSDRKIAAIGRKAGLLYKAIHKEVLEAYRCAGGWQLLEEMPKLTGNASEQGDGHQPVGSGGNNSPAGNSPGVDRKTR
jgi:hypothetical protein